MKARRAGFKLMIDLNETRPVRRGEELALEHLREFLAEHLSDASGSSLEVAQFPHGHSNLTYLLKLGDRELVLRRPPFGNPVKSAHDMGREYRVLSRLAPVYDLAPRPLAYCEDEGVIGAPFYVMERRQGIVLRGGRLPPDLAIDAFTMRAMCESLIDNLARLHRLDYEKAGLGDLGKPAGYVERQVSGWSERFVRAQTAPSPHMEALSAWLARERPADSSAALIHNDYKFDNLLLDPANPARIVAVLDWEMATIGDPWMDLGTTLAYWVEARDPDGLKHMVCGPTMSAGSPSRQALAERYQSAVGHAAPALLFYYVFGLFKIAVIVQQIYARYVRGATRDERFAHLDVVVDGLAEAGARAIETASF